MSQQLKRTNVLITEAQSAEVHRRGLNLSGLVRDLLDDRFSNSSVTITLSARAKELYDTVVSNFGASDKELEPFLLEALDKFLKQKERKIAQLRSSIQKP
jgi:hypothetical protein